MNLAHELVIPAIGTKLMAVGESVVGFVAARKDAKFSCRVRGDALVTGNTYRTDYRTDPVCRLYLSMLLFPPFYVPREVPSAQPTKKLCSI